MSNTFKICLICPECGNTNWINRNENFECAACGEIVELEEMSSKVMDEQDVYFTCDASKKTVPENEDEWIPVSSGKLPKENQNVQVTYLSVLEYEKDKPYCDVFAHMRVGKWIWSDDFEEVKVKITAWKPIGKPYKGE